jgi:hypothetical protein
MIDNANGNATIYTVSVEIGYLFATVDRRNGICERASYETLSTIRNVNGDAIWNCHPLKPTRLALYVSNFDATKGGSASVHVYPCIL